MNEERQFEADWERMLLAWMHDPADKAMNILQHVSRAAKYASRVLGREVSVGELKGQNGDQMASAIERIPMMSADQLKIGLDGGSLEIRHPLSGEPRLLQLGVEKLDLGNAYEASVSGCDSHRLKFLSLWRKLFDEASKVEMDLGMIPAETRNPDHTIWQHLDTTAGIALTDFPGAGGMAILRLQVGPVQRFIEASRSMSDLVTSSYLLSDLTFAAMQPILRRCGPTAFVFPALRGLARMDQWLAQEGVPIKVDPEGLRSAAIPNKFLAIVPHAIAAQLAEESSTEFQRHWRRISEQVRKRVEQSCGKLYPGWDRNWDSQIEGFFEVQTSWFRLKDLRMGEFGLEPEEVGVAGLLKKTPYAKGGKAGLWQAAVAYSEQLMEAERRIRPIAVYRPEGEIGEKCTLLGSYEQLGPARRSEAEEFWKLAHQIDGEREDAGQESDRLCAVSMVKRRAMKDFYSKQYPMDMAAMVDTRQMSGRCKEPENCTYYAMLMLDGDEMGKWLSGNKSPQISEVLVQRARDWFEKEGCGEDLKSRRPVSPALHAAISAGLGRFACEITPSIVKKHHGIVIYSGGDDVLAAVPMDRALACAMELREAFRGNAVMGSKASCSVGLAIAHYKEDLRYVLDQTRRAEKTAKAAGRDRLSLAILRRNGEHAVSTCRWKWVKTLDEMRKSFLGADASDRWAYQMRAQEAVLGVLPDQAFRREMNRQLERSEMRDERFLGYWDQFEEEAGGGGAQVQSEFIRFVQSSSFLARGRDQRED